MHLVGAWNRRKQHEAQILAAELVKLQIATTQKVQPVTAERNDQKTLDAFFRNAEWV